MSNHIQLLTEETPNEPQLLTEVADEIKMSHSLLNEIGVPKGKLTERILSLIQRVEKTEELCS